MKNVETIIVSVAAANLLSLAELIKLSAETVKALATCADDDLGARIVDAANRLEAAANDLVDAGHKMDQPRRRT